LLSLASIASCGGDDDDSGGAKCGAGAPCGGDVIGTWQIQESCAYGSFVDQMDSMCSGGTVDANGMKITGTWKFNADKTYASDTVLNGTTKVTIPESCLKGDGVSLTCQQFGAFYGALAALGGGEVTADCTGSSTCSCNIKFKDAKDNESRHLCHERQQDHINRRR
jgi:hypothetical protein